jgi:UDP-3-O-[3-hydroxymyristoyl] glucosamine N-acyltransferase
VPAFEGSQRRLAELAERYGGVVDEAAREVPIRGVTPLDDGTSLDLCPFTSRRHLSLALGSPALLLVDMALAPLIPAGRRWVHPHAVWAVASLLEDFVPEAVPERHPHAQIDADAELADDVSVGAGAIIMAGARLGPGCVIEPQAVIYGRVVLGRRVRVGAGAVVGRPGFGWASGPGGSVKRVPQLGGVVAHDDVEIGPLATIDAGTLGPTVLGRGVRLDAHVHVAHNVQLGDGTMVAAQSGFAGSVRVGRFVRVGGQVGVADHVAVGDRAELAAKAGVIGDIAAGQTVAGYPAVERISWLRGMARMLRAGRERSAPINPAPERSAPINPAPERSAPNISPAREQPQAEPPKQEWEP